MRIINNLKKNWPNYLLLVISVIITLILAELSLRWLLKNPHRSPNKTLHVTNYEFQYTTTLNSFGFRDSEFSKEKAENTFRIFLIGDSFVYSPGVPDEKKLDRLLEDKLNQTGGRKFEVYNLGLPGGTYNYVQTAKEFVSYQPDLIILSIYVDNDINRFNIDKVILLELHEVWFLAKGNISDYFTKIKGKLNSTTPQPTNNESTASSSASILNNNQQTSPDFYRQLAQEKVINTFLFERAKAGDNQQFYDKLANKFKYFPATKSNILKVKKTYDDLPFVLLINPSKYQISTSSFAELRKMGFIFNEDKIIDRHVQDEIINWAEKKNITYVDPLPAMLENTNQPYFYLIDDHYNENGDKLVAEKLYDTLINEGLINN
ncbi:MAG: SGNH/GDSL hydrolase family protein [Patescibacteria group bacterium]|jgi:hypothetical protein